MGMKSKLRLLLLAASPFAGSQRHAFFSDKLKAYRIENHVNSWLD